jgi:hypothetical protein
MNNKQLCDNSQWKPKDFNWILFNIIVGWRMEKKRHTDEMRKQVLLVDLLWGGRNDTFHFFYGMYDLYLYDIQNRESWWQLEKLKWILCNSCTQFHYLCWKHHIHFVANIDTTQDLSISQAAHVQIFEIGYARFSGEIFIYWHENTKSNLYSLLSKKN